MRRWAFSMCSVVAVVMASTSAVQASAPVKHPGPGLFWGLHAKPTLDQGFGFWIVVGALGLDDDFAERRLAVSEIVAQHHPF